MKTGWTVRKMRACDLDRICEMEKMLFASPWSRQSFMAELGRKGGLAVVAEEEGTVFGYAVGWSVADELHIANLAVHPDRQRLGIGRGLLRALLEGFEGLAWAGLEVRESNAPAIALYQSMGFKKTGLRKNYYAEEKENAVLMEMAVPAGDTPQMKG
jgi:ribosomal-protein-alanine N-acetyltransferase